MTDLDYDDDPYDDEDNDFDDRWEDPLFDDLHPPKEEPDCGACDDTGYRYDNGKRCKSCNPSRLEHWWWRGTWRIRQRIQVFRYRHWRKRHNPFNDDAPF